MVQESHLITCLTHYWSATFRLRWKKESISEHVTKLEEKNRNFGFFTVFFFDSPAQSEKVIGNDQPE